MTFKEALVEVRELALLLVAGILLSVIRVLATPVVVVGFLVSFTLYLLVRFLDRIFFRFI